MDTRFVNSLNAKTLSMMSNETLREVAAFEINPFTRFAVSEARLILARRDYAVTTAE